jgi:hypothetical protein
MVELKAVDRLLDVCTPFKAPATNPAQVPPPAQLRTRHVLVAAATVLHVLSASSPEVFQTVLNKNGTEIMERVYHFMGGKKTDNSSNAHASASTASPAPAPTPSPSLASATPTLSPALPNAGSATASAPPAPPIASATNNTAVATK